MYFVTLRLSRTIYAIYICNKYVNNFINALYVVLTSSYVFAAKCPRVHCTTRATTPHRFGERYCMNRWADGREFVSPSSSGKQMVPSPNFLKIILQHCIVERRLLLQFVNVQTLVNRAVLKHHTVSFKTFEMHQLLKCPPARLPFILRNLS